MALAFQGTALALSSNGLAAVANSLGVHAPEIWAVLAVETKGCGYLPDRRPQILYERHIFHRLTRGQFDDGDISDPSSGGYGATGTHQYERLSAAIAKDRIAALQSASWGLGQIMGENFAAAAFPNIEDMVAAMAQSEDAQLTAMGNFLIATNLRASLQAHDWMTFARRYNGPNFAINRYDVRLNGEFQRFSVGALPDLNVRAANPRQRCRARKSNTPRQRSFGSAYFLVIGFLVCLWARYYRFDHRCDWNAEARARRQHQA